MYWNNPILEFTWPCEQDPVKDSMHSGSHCLFYDPDVDRTKIRSNQSLQDLCNWANNKIEQQGIAGFLEDANNHYDIANLVKLNLWVDDLPRRGSIKPMLLQYVGKELYESGTGESRLRAMERIPSMQTVKAVISTHANTADRFGHLEQIHTFDQFAQVCGAILGQQFLFRLTDAEALYGIDWYEYNSHQTAQTTPGQDYCVRVLSAYLQNNPNTVFTPEWFDHLVDWRE